MIKFKENTQTDGRTEGHTDSYFIGSLWLLPGVYKYNCSRLTLKSQRYRVQCWSNKNYCITVSMQKISSIHTLTFKIQQSLVSCKLSGQTYFWPHLLKNQWHDFKLSWICTSMQKITLFHPFIFEVQSILESHDQTSHTHFWPHPPKNFWSNFNLCEFVSTCKKPGYFTDLFWRYGWLNNPAIWLADNILAYISGTKLFPNMGSVQEHSK